jgi:hypothetical protein
VQEAATPAVRDAQFQLIADQSQQFLAAGDPVISVDTKKKEKIGNYKTAGREYAPQGQPPTVNTHDFGDRDDQGQIIHGLPYGVYEPLRNVGWVSVGVDHDTAAFAVNTIGQWWSKMGLPAYPHSRRVMITADSGGSNGRRLRAWKTELQRLADHTGCHRCERSTATIISIAAATSGLRMTLIASRMLIGSVRSRKRG